MIRTLALLAFALLVACHRGPTTTRVRAIPFPALPDTLYTATGAVPVLLVDTIGTSDSTKLVVGRFDAFHHRLYVLRRIVDPKARWRIAEHERCHAILLESGLGLHMSNEFEDFVCNAFAAAAVNQLERGRIP